MRRNLKRKMQLVSEFVAKRVKVGLETDADQIKQRVKADGFTVPLTKIQVKRATSIGAVLDAQDRLGLNKEGGLP